MSSEKRLLPSLAVLLNESRPAIANLRPNFCSGEEGFIRLPPLGDSGTRAVESAVRYTVNLPIPSGTPAASSHLQSQAEPLSVATPSTPVVKKKSLASSSRKNEIMTPLSAARAVITPSNSEKKRAFAFITHSQETFPTKEPKIDNAPLARRKRRRTSTQELNILQAEFSQCPAPDKRKRQELAERCNMSEKAVQIWFQNKRQATKRQKNSAQKAATAIVTAPLDSTPLASKQQIDNHTKSKQTTETAPETSSSDTTPTKAVPAARNQQALTFHLASNDVLTPVKPRSAANSPRTKPTGSPTKRIPLNELKINALVH